MRHPCLIGLLLVTPPAIADRVPVAAGTFQMGCSLADPYCEKDEGPPGGIAVRLPAFLIDRYEVTVADYRRCVAAGACSPPKTHQRNRYCNYDAVGRDDHPVNCVDWPQAVAYCTWADGRLPTEAEWEKAARAGSKGPYPWGDSVGCEQAILDPVSPAPSPREPDGCFTDRSWPVGSRAPNAWGLHDAHGNIGEWVANWYAPDAIARLYAAGDLSGPERGRQRVARGGSWDENRPNLRSSFRNAKPPEQGRAIYGSIGFRCAQDPN